ncbi:MAG TPA: arylamine N-acetyltransferase [Rhizomicrobium sp.]|nr:arylamine N-acetyltransferase [Rhizomicrobium sp.]
MQIDAYLDRIGFSGRPARDLAGLTALHRAHLRAIPYENIDVQLGRKVTTAIPAIYGKIVDRRRGGWCYEMNGMLGWALGELGFDVTRATGAVVREIAGQAMEGNHLVLRVQLPEGLYLADVGFGDGPLDPIRITPGSFEAGGFSFGLEKADPGWWRLRNHRWGGAPSFDFHLERASEALLSEKCEFLQTSPMSPFVQNLVAQRFVPGGLLVLRGRVLRRVTPDGVSDTLLQGADELVAALKRDFDLDVPEVAALWPKIVERHEAVMAQKPAVS